MSLAEQMYLADCHAAATAATDADADAYAAGTDTAARDCCGEVTCLGDMKTATEMESETMAPQLTETELVAPELMEPELVAPKLMAPELIAPEFFWTEEDAYYTKLFRAWDNLPVHDAARETGLLWELDEIIVAFDVYIGHSDAGFLTWMRRHQEAMELGLAETPTWPKLYRAELETGSKNKKNQKKKWKKKWKDEVWISRYSFLVHQRDVIAKSRLRQMRCCAVEDKARFFGGGWAAPRQTVRTVQSKNPARLRSLWYEPIGWCLERVTYESGGRLELERMRAEFWGGLEEGAGGGGGGGGEGPDFYV